jgi:predicted transglutaminase-like cysteine proteinase
MLGPMVKRVAFGNFTLAPMASTQFCLRYADQCKPPQIVFRGGPFRLTEERWADLKEVNQAVNAPIVPEPNTEGLAGERWLINPARVTATIMQSASALNCSCAAGRLARCF